VPIGQSGSQGYGTLKLDVPPVLLKAAGAIAVRATSRQVRQFTESPLIKSIRPNRKLG
jgi:hypothetical protein